MSVHTLRALAGAAGIAIAAPSADAQIATQRVASGLAYPVYATAPAGDAQRLFILQQRGQILILENGSLLARPFLDLDALIPNISGNDERGLLGLVFAPDYATSGHFYVHYSDLAGDTRIRRYTVSADPDSADPASGLDILWVDQPASNHNGGSILFGPDGYLWIGLGDGGGSYDTYGNGQNPATLLGKMLRIDPTGDDFPGDPLRNYRIPPSNPFVGEPTFRDEIWAYGLRNPYRWSFDRLTGDRWIADVGQACWEEVDFEPASHAGGRNYGWPRLEGNHCVTPGTCFSTGCDSTGTTFPVREYSHTQDGFSCSITGGCVYRGNAIPSLGGTYFYADFCSGQIYSFRYDGSSLTQLTNRTAELAPGGGLAITSVSAFGEDGVGELYIVDRSATAGEVYKIVPDPDFVGVRPEDSRRTALEVGPAVPNPFEERTRFDVRLVREAPLRVRVYDAGGRLVRTIRDDPAPAGALPLEWDGRDTAGRVAPAGIYFLRVESEGVVQTRRLTRLR